MTNLNISRRTWQLVAWTGVVAVLGVSLLPVDVPQQLRFWNYDKLVHMSMYASLMLSFSQAHDRRLWPRIALALAGYGVLIEFLQSLTPDRDASALDELANVLGISIMLWLVSRPRASTLTPK